MMFSRSRLPAVFVFASILLQSRLAWQAETNSYIPATPSETTSEVDFTFKGQRLDGVHVHPFNRTTFQFWQFDALPHDTSPTNPSAINVAFIAGTNEAFPLGSQGNTSILSVALSGRFPNGTLFYYTAEPKEALVVTKGEEYASACWGSHFGSWVDNGSSYKDYTIRFKNAKGYVHGEAQLRSLAPPHLPCNKASSGSTLPHVGYANPVPSGKVLVDFNINGTPFKWEGIGNFDTNWGDQPFFRSIKHRFWGHGQIGPYSVAWLNTTSPSGRESTTGYFAKDGKILFSSCTPGAVTVETAHPNSKSSIWVRFANFGGRSFSINVTNSLQAPTPFEPIASKMQLVFDDDAERHFGVGMHQEY